MHCRRGDSPEAPHAQDDGTWVTLHSAPWIQKVSWSSIFLSHGTEAMENSCGTAVLDALHKPSLALHCSSTCADGTLRQIWEGLPKIQAGRTKCLQRKTKNKHPQGQHSNWCFPAQFLGYALSLNTDKVVVMVEGQKLQ